MKRTIHFLRSVFFIPLIIFFILFVILVLINGVDDTLTILLFGMYSSEGFAIYAVVLAISIWLGTKYSNYIDRVHSSKQ